jgi:ATP-dependent DNA helicase RecQ
MVVIGTLLGAKRAKLREIGATSYKTYGALSSCSESELRMLINHMIQEGYLYQTDDKYSVLRMGNEINKLLDKDAKIIVRTYEEKENESKKLKTARARSTDVLTTAGFDLFDELRALRLEIAREESMPPYIIFNDKTLIDMCAKLPSNKAGMLDVNGVGENKFSKYGQRFIDKIQEFVANHPGIVISEAGNVLSDSGTINNSVISDSRANNLQKKS